MIDLHTRRGVMLDLLAIGSLKRVGQTIRENYQLKNHGLKGYSPKIVISKKVGHLEIKTAETTDELCKAFALRHEVFFQEMQGIAKKGLDIDQYDIYCDHLIIKDTRTNEVMGTYRLNCTQFQSEHFYSENEFNIEKLLQLPGQKVELGRACIHKDHRRGVIISLLWKGISEYMNKANVDILFGCATVKTEDPYIAALLSKYFSKRAKVYPYAHVAPQANMGLPLIDLWNNYFKEHELTLEDEKKAEELLPPLCRAYLKLGAYVGAQPAWDKDFACIDFLTILSRDDLNKSQWKKYSQTSDQSTSI